VKLVLENLVDRTRHGTSAGRNTPTIGPDSQQAQVGILHASRLGIFDVDGYDFRYPICPECEISFPQINGEGHVRDLIPPLLDLFPRLIPFFCCEISVHKQKLSEGGVRRERYKQHLRVALSGRYPHRIGVVDDPQFVILKVEVEARGLVLNGKIIGVSDFKNEIKANG
jgi:hypothetical protein